MTWRVTYAIDSHGRAAEDEIDFEEQWEALEFLADEMHRRVDFQVQHTPFKLSAADIREIEEHETQLVRIDHLV
jgi:hypothetical protein